MTQNLNHYEKILSRSHSNYLAQISIEMTDANNQINDVLSKLTALGTVLIPMNLITGAVPFITRPSASGACPESHTLFFLLIDRSLGNERPCTRTGYRGTSLPPAFRFFAAHPFVDRRVMRGLLPSSLRSPRLRLLWVTRPIASWFDVERGEKNVSVVGGRAGEGGGRTRQTKNSEGEHGKRVVSRLSGFFIHLGLFFSLFFIFSFQGGITAPLEVWIDHLSRFLFPYPYPGVSFSRFFTRFARTRSPAHRCCRFPENLLSSLSLFFFTAFSFLPAAVASHFELVTPYTQHHF